MRDSIGTGTGSGLLHWPAFSRDSAEQADSCSWCLALWGGSSLHLCSDILKLIYPTLLLVLGESVLLADLGLAV